MDPCIAGCQQSGGAAGSERNFQIHYSSPMDMMKRHPKNERSLHPLQFLTLSLQFAF